MAGGVRGRPIGPATDHTPKLFVDHEGPLQLADDRVVRQVPLEQSLSLVEDLDALLDFGQLGADIVDLLGDTLQVGHARVVEEHHDFIFSLRNVLIEVALLVDQLQKEDALHRVQFFDFGLLRRVQLFRQTKQLPQPRQVLALGLEVPLLEHLEDFPALQNAPVELADVDGHLLLQFALELEETLDVLRLAAHLVLDFLDLADDGLDLVAPALGDNRQNPVLSRRVDFAQFVEEPAHVDSEDACRY